jgi:hypothetical protein
MVLKTVPKLWSRPRNRIAGPINEQQRKDTLMMVIVLRARRTPEGLGDEYRYRFKRMSEIAVTMPGYISHKGF